MRYPVDRSDCSAVVRCTVCGWRALALDGIQALRAAREHERRAHVGESAAKNLLAVAEHRARRRAEQP